MIRTLAQLRAGDLPVAGGKGANLGELVAAGLPVPPGFVVTTTAYDCFVDQYQLNQPIRQLLADLPVDAAKREATEHGASIRVAFERAAIPPVIASAVARAYQQLGQGAVAVHSSATAEDLPGMAFAGQQDTYLNIMGEEALLEAVRRCWASLWTDRAIAYRQRASAIVVDGGSVGSHAAIVAREYGIPAVMGTVDGTQRLVDGQRVRVDGHRGWVMLLHDNVQ